MRHINQNKYGKLAQLVECSTTYYCALDRDCDSSTGDAAHPLPHAYQSLKLNCCVSLLKRDQTLIGKLTSSGILMSVCWLVS